MSFVKRMPLVRERRFDLRRVVRGHGERRLAEPEKAGTDLFGNGQAVMQGAGVRAARASAATLFAGGLATGDDDGEGEDCEKWGDGFHVSRWQTA